MLSLISTFFLGVWDLCVKKVPETTKVAKQIPLCSGH